VVENRYAVDSGRFYVPTASLGACIVDTDDTADAVRHGGDHVEDMRLHPVTGDYNGNSRKRRQRKLLAGAQRPEMMGNAVMLNTSLTLRDPLKTPSSTSRWHWQIRVLIVLKASHTPNGSDICTADPMSTELRFFASENRVLAGFYVLLVLPILLALNTVFVPFHAPDDYDHLKRAYTLEHGLIWPVTEPGRSTGGYIDSELARVIDAQRTIVISWPRVGSVQPPDASDSSSIDKAAARWSGRKVYSEFGAAGYLPLLYAPQAAALWLGERLGERLGLTIYQSVFAARLVNGTVAVLIIGAALIELPLATGTILFVLLLPKTLLQFASNSVDPVLHATTLAIIAFTAKALMTGWMPRARHFVLTSFGILALAGVRPPLVFITALPLWIAVRDRNIVGMVALVGAAVGAMSWFALVLPMMVDLRCGPTGSFAEKLWTFLTRGPVLIARTLFVHANYYYASFVGELGWGNGPAGRLDRLPLWIYVAAVPVALCATAYDLGQAIRPSLELRAILSLCAIAIVGAIFFAMYVGCTNSGSDVIGGVQGRYFVTPVLLVMPALAGLLPRRGIFEGLYPPVLLIFALASFATLMVEGLRIYWIST
jgi:hypothetical protein